MRITDPIDLPIVGAGPAGCAAAIALAKLDACPLLIDRDEQVGDPLCGGFLSWRTAEQLRALGVAPERLGAHRVDRLRLFDGRREVELDLPQQAYGLSRHALDTAMRAEALARGAGIAFDTVREVREGEVLGKANRWESPFIFLATGKHDVRGQARPRRANDSTVGIRLRLPASPAREQLLAGAIELHLFRGGYLGIVLQEGGSANLCLAVRKSALAQAGGSPAELFTRLAESNAALAARIGDGLAQARFDTIGAVPYGWVCRDTTPGIWRLGDQAAVIPSLAGEGISIAIASGTMAARCWHETYDAGDFQHRFAARVRRPVRLASAMWLAAEHRLGARAALALAQVAPGIIANFADRARIPPSTPLARP